MPFEDQSRAEQGDVAEGEKGTAFLASLTGEGIVEHEQAQAFNQQAQDVLASANEGGWAISEEGMNAYIKACDAFLDRYPDIIREVRQLTRRVQLGSSPYAYAVADFNVTVANGDEHSLIPNLKLMRDGYEKLREALTVARRNYDEQEESVVQNLGKLVAPDDVQ